MKTTSKMKTTSNTSLQYRTSCKIQNGRRGLCNGRNASGIMHACVCSKKIRQRWLNHSGMGGGWSWVKFPYERVFPTAVVFSALQYYFSTFRNYQYIYNLLKSSSVQQQWCQYQVSLQALPILWCSFVSHLLQTKTVQDWQVVFCLLWWNSIILTIVVFSFLIRIFRIIFFICHQIKIYIWQKANVPD